MSKVIVIDVSSVDRQKTSNVDEQYIIVEDEDKVNQHESPQQPPPQQQQQQQPPQQQQQPPPPLPQQQQPRPQQERNGSFKFSTTTYCGVCEKVLLEDSIGQCNDCSNDKVNIDDSKDVVKDCKETSMDNTTNLQLVVEECHSMNQQPSPTKSITNERICRICLDNIDQGDLIAPCKCSGSTKFAHESCMLKWFFKSSKKSCEVCLGNVNVKPIGFKPFQEWRLPESGCDFIVYLFGLYFLIMVIFTGMITWIATQGCISPVCVTLYTVCAVAVFYFFYCCGCVEYSRKYWKALLSVNKVWRIYGRADSLKNFKHHVRRGEVQTPGSIPQNRQDMQPYVIDVSAKNKKKDIDNNNKKPMGIHNLALEIDDAQAQSV